MRHVCHAVLALVLGAGMAHADTANPMQESESWSILRENIFEDPDAIRPGNDLLTLDAPERAHDAAVVPVHITQDGDARIEALTLVIDENPAPMAARFEFGEAMGPLDFETRVRVDQYSNMRAVADLGSGDQIMVGRFVKASGGCSAPASKDAVEALKTAGQMRVKNFAGDGDRAEAQVMIRHPNFSGLQRDQVTHLFVPANFIVELEVTQGDDLLFRMEGGISISENPAFRFKYDDNGAESIRVRAVDTDGNVYQQEFGKALL